MTTILLFLAWSLIMICYYIFCDDIKKKKDIKKRYFYSLIVFIVFGIMFYINSINVINRVKNKQYDTQKELIDLNKELINLKDLDNSLFDSFIPDEVQLIDTIKIENNVTFKVINKKPPSK